TDRTKPSHGFGGTLHPLPNAIVLWFISLCSLNFKQTNIGIVRCCNFLLLVKQPASRCKPHIRLSGAQPYFTYHHIFKRNSCTPGNSQCIGSSCFWRTYFRGPVPFFICLC